MATQTGHEQAEERKAEWFDGCLEVQEKEEPINERDEQAAEEPPKTLVVGQHQKSDLPVQAADESNSQQYVSQHNHFQLPLLGKAINIQGERREAAVSDARFVSELDGCLPFAPPCGLGNPDTRLVDIGLSKTGF